MLKKLLISTALVAAISTSASAEPFDKKYFKLDTGMSLPIKTKYEDGDSRKMKFKNSAAFGIGFGTEIADGFRAELNIMQRNIKSKSSPLMDKGEVVKAAYDNKGKLIDEKDQKTINSTTSFKPLTFMANVLYDFKVDDMFTPYAGFGLGMTKITPNEKVDKTIYDTKGDVVPPQNVFAKKSYNSVSWQLALGTGIKATESMTFDVGYRYSHLGNFKLSRTDGKHKFKLASHEFMAGLRINF